MTGTAALAEAVRAFVESQPKRGAEDVQLEVAEHGGEALVSGRVLTARQASAVRELARRHDARVHLLVAADPGSGLESAWVQPAVEVLDLWRRPSGAGEEMGRQTQYLRGDGALRRFGTDGDFALVQGRDLAMGWARTAELEATDAIAARQAWAVVARAAAGTTRAPATPRATVGAVLQRARAELDVPYVWGGTTHAGYDCSGLVQRVFMESTGVLLPRHTADQRRMGSRVVDQVVDGARAGVRAGDLLFAAPLNQKVGHVLLMTSPTTVLHACRTEHRVIEEDLEENARRYRHQGFRRPLELQPEGRLAGAP